MKAVLLFEIIISKFDLGNIQRELKLNFETGTSVSSACGAVLNGQHWFIGGLPDRSQVSY